MTRLNVRNDALIISTHLCSTTKIRLTCLLLKQDKLDIVYIFFAFEAVIISNYKISGQSIVHKELFMSFTNYTMGTSTGRFVHKGRSHREWLS